jgi:hypothetical protein
MISAANRQRDVSEILGTVLLRHISTSNLSASVGLHRRLPKASMKFRCPNGHCATVTEDQLHGMQYTCIHRPR